MEPVAGDTDRMETDRLLLRRFSGEDAEALLAFLGDPEVNEFLPMFPLRDAAEAERYLRYIGDWGPAGRTLLCGLPEGKAGACRLRACERRRQPRSGIRPRTGVLEPWHLHRDLPGGDRTAEADGRAVCHGDARREQSAERSRDAGRRHDLPLLVSSNRLSS